MKKQPKILQFIPDVVTTILVTVLFLTGGFFLYKFLYPSSLPKEKGEFCGGIAGVACPEGFTCKLSTNHPDAEGACIKENFYSTKAKPLTLIMERSGCFGTCPAYAVSITEDNLFTFEGKAFVKTNEIKQKKLQQKQVEDLINSIESTHFFKLNDQYIQKDATDMETITLTISYNGQTKTLIHYLGDHSAPEELTTLETSIDKIVNIKDYL